jgi:hypothetical protein
VAANAGISDGRVRVICHLPYRDQLKFRKAYDEVILYVRTQRTRKPPVTGYTHSDTLPVPVFHGYWWGKPKPGAKYQWISDEIVMLFIDVKTNMHEKSFLQFLKRLKKHILAVYSKNKCSQQEIWIVAQNAPRG